MSKWFKLLALVSATIVAATITSVASAKAKRSSAVTLKFWIMPNSANPAQDMQEILQPFTSSTGTAVSVESVDWGSAFGRIQAAAIGGGGPDVTQVGTTWNPYMASLGGFVDLTSKLSQVGGRAAFPTGAFQTVLIKGRAGVWGLPWFIEARMIFYRKDVLKKVHLTAAKAFKNWTTFKTTLAKINNANVSLGGKRIAPFGTPGRNTWDVCNNMMPWVWGAGGDSINSAATKAVINSAKSRTGVMFLTGLVQQGLVYRPAIEQNAAQVETMFKNGTTAVHLGGPWIVGAAGNPEDTTWNALARKNFGVAPMPIGPSGKRYTFLGGSNLMIYKSSSHQDEAWALVKYLMTSDAQTKMLKLVGMLPSKTANMKTALKVYPKYAPFVPGITKYGKSEPAIPKWGDIESILVKYFSNIYDIATGAADQGYSKTSVQAELNKAASEINNVLAS